MKTKVILMLYVSLLLSIVFTACTKEYPEGLIEGISSDKYVILPKADYREYVQVGQKKGKVSIYPSRGDAGNYWQQLEKGYYYAPWLFVHGMFLDTKFSEYDEIWNLYFTDEYKNKDILDTLNSRILEKDPYLEIYKLLDVSDFMVKTLTGNIINGEEQYQVSLDKEKLNKMIETGEFFTYEGVKRIK
ncbi:MAG: hypothetical protein MJ204_08855 [Bacteroidales bacterium]|nr:hypothetical protein [Bacteroidales bacterium]